MPDYYFVLQVSSDATENEIYRSYKSLAVKWHPDKNPGDEKAAKKFMEISQAYTVLKNPEQRKQYDLEISKKREHAFSKLRQLVNKAKYINYTHKAAEFVSNNLAPLLMEYKEIFKEDTFKETHITDIHKAEDALLAEINKGLAIDDKHLKCFLNEIKYEILNLRNYTGFKSNSEKNTLVQKVLKSHPNKIYAEQMSEILQRLEAIEVKNKDHITIKDALRNIIAEFIIYHRENMPTVGELKNLREILVSYLESKRHTIPQFDQEYKGRKVLKEPDISWHDSFFGGRPKAIKYMFQVIDMLPALIKSLEEQKAAVFETSPLAIVPFQKK